MKTEDILNLNCTVSDNLKKMNSFLWKVKPLKGLLERNNYTKTQIAPLELLEQVLHGISIKYKYKTQGISTYYEDNAKFVFYTVSLLKVRETNHWIGNVYGRTLWEVTAKTIIKIYADIMSDREVK